MHSLHSVSRPPRMDIVDAVLESALDAGVTEYVSICRRLIVANRRGWNSHADKNDWKAVLEAYEDVCRSQRQSEAMSLIEWR